MPEKKQKNKSTTPSVEVIQDDEGLLTYYVSQKGVNILRIPHVHSDLAPACQKNSEIGLPPPPLTEKI